MKPRIKKQVFSLALALSLSFGMTEQTAKLTLAASNGADKLYSATAEKIDIYKKNKKPNARNYKADWNAGIFYTLEDINTKSSKDGQLKKYKLVRKELINKKNGNRIEYEVYKHPKTGKMHKITSIEHRKNDLEITDYYYDDKGKPNFVYQRKDSIYTPIYADFNRTGDRYFFNNDSLIKWRWVKKANDVEEITLKVDKGRKDVKQHGFSTVSKAKKKAYDKKEVRMLNAAYNTYKAMLKKPKMSIAKGYIVDAKRKPIANATVEFLRSNKVVGKVKTNSKGYYNTGVLPVKGGYTIRVSANGYQTLEGVKAIIDKTGAVIWIDVINLVPVSEASHKVSVNVYDGETVKYDNDNVVRTFLSGTEVIARRGVNNKTGEQVATGTTDGSGNLVIELTSGVYTLEIRMNGYVVGYRTVTVDEDKNVSVALTKPVTDKQMKVVLSWEGDQDLDSYLFTPYRAKKGNMAYIGGSAKKDKHGNRLYLDGKNGNNVEIINIANIKNGYYKYYVSDYTNSLKKNYSAKDMAGLNIRVEVYGKNGLVAVYIIPYNSNGVIWEVFEIKNGKVVPLQNTYKNVKGKKWWLEKKKSDDLKRAEEERKAEEIRKAEEAKKADEAKIVIPFKYDNAGSFSEGLAPVCLGNEFWGYIDKEDKVVIPFKYQEAESFVDGLAKVKLNGKWGYINSHGEGIIPIKYDEVSDFKDGFVRVKLKGKYGYRDSYGNRITYIKYEEARDFSEGLAVVKLNGKYGYIDRGGDEVTPFKYDNAWDLYKGAAKVMLNGKYGYLDNQGNEKYSPEYDIIEYFDDEFKYRILTDESDYLDSNGNRIVPYEYEDFFVFDTIGEGLAAVKLNGKWGFINRQEDRVTPIKYDDVWKFKEGRAVVKLYGRYGYVDRYGDEVIPSIYDDAWDFNEGVAPVKLNGTFGYIDEDGNYVIPLMYEVALGFGQGLAPVKLNGKWGFISR